jgi:hypothetical protein
MFYKGFLGVFTLIDGPVPRTASQSMMDGSEGFGPSGRAKAWAEAPENRPGHARRSPPWPGDDAQAGSMSF